MKAFYAVFLLVFLASCGSDTAVETTTPETPDSAMEQTVDDMESEMDDLPEDISDDETASAESEVEVLQAPYTNPAGPVDMQIEYTLDSDGTIASIDVSATTYDLTQFNQGAQAVVGMTPEEAGDYTFSGSSLTGPAFNDAMKSVAM